VARIVAILGWRTAALLKDNIGFLERAGLAGRVRPRDWRAGASKYRTLAVYEDGRCELLRPTAAAVARRLGGAGVGTHEGTKRGSDRG
jgi:hypothetical protein